MQEKQQQQQRKMPVAAEYWLLSAIVKDYVYAYIKSDRYLFVSTRTKTIQCVHIIRFLSRKSNKKHAYAHKHFSRPRVYMFEMIVMCREFQ